MTLATRRSRSTLFIALAALVCLGGFQAAKGLNAKRAADAERAKVQAMVGQFLEDWGLPHLSEWTWASGFLTHGLKGVRNRVEIKDSAGRWALLLCPKTSSKVAQAWLPALPHAVSRETGPLSERFARSLLAPYIGAELAAQVPIEEYGEGELLMQVPSNAGSSVGPYRPFKGYFVVFDWKAKQRKYHAGFETGTRLLRRCGIAGY